MDARSQEMFPLFLFVRNRKAVVESDVVPESYAFSLEFFIDR
jgi:hypothetical protein